VSPKEKTVTMDVRGQALTGYPISPLKNSLRAAFRAGKRLYVDATAMREARSEFLNGLL